MKSTSSSIKALNVLLLANMISFLSQEHTYADAVMHHCTIPHRSLIQDVGGLRLMMIWKEQSVEYPIKMAEGSK